MMTAAEIVNSLDKYIIGQSKAKRAVAIALRNRYRRLKLPVEIREEICPKNIIMMGPTGVGKTEIARRLAKLVDAPFVKVEATKFTEVGYVGRDVDSMIRDLVEVSFRMTKDMRTKTVQEAALLAAEKRIVELIKKAQSPEENKDDDTLTAGLLSMFVRKYDERNLGSDDSAPEEDTDKPTEAEDMLTRVHNGEFDDVIIEVSVEQSHEVVAMGIDFNMGEVLESIMPKKRKNRKVSVAEARKLLTAEEAEKLVDMDDVTREAVEKAEQSGIIFIDEMDKIAVSRNSGNGDHDVSREGVQRDILPVVEGCTVSTKYGIVNTDHILFIAAGAFQMTKVSDLIPELQGRFPIKVELSPLTADDFKLILTQPRNATIKQYQALLEADNVTVNFCDDAIELIAKYAAEFNELHENIGARRLHTILEDLLDEVSFQAGENGDEHITVNIDAEYVKSHVSGDTTATDLRRFII